MIPDYQTLMRPTLRLAANGELHGREAVRMLAEELALTPEELAQTIPSGQETLLYNRFHWAKTYLKQAGLVRIPRRGYFEITDRGREVLADPAINVDASFLNKFPEFLEFKTRRRAPSTEAAEPAEMDSALGGSATPDEQLRAAYTLINDALAAELIDKMRSASPAFFEEIIVQLFVAMGYGGSSDEAGRALGRSGDDGVDGVIDQDVLGVDQVYLQAKRYGEGNNVGAGDIRDFYGALSLKRAQKGVFVTTSNFTESARETARGLGTRIVLINGSELARLAVRYDIGCRIESSLHLKKLDEEFFEEGSDAS
jgi:restriction system protein